MSKPFSLPSGVPQRSRLGPLLFLTFVNDTSLYEQNCKVPLFADDIKSFSCVRSRLNCETLQHYTLAVATWCLINYLLLNEPKTKTMSLTRKRDPLVFTYAIGSSIIACVPVIRDLGVLVESSFNLNHVSTICSVSVRNLVAISRFTRQFFSLLASRAYFAA